MARTKDPRRQCVHMGKWPLQDQALWEASVAVRPSSFKAVRYAETLEPASIAKAEEGYGRWLGFLTWHGALGTAAQPGSRVKAELLEEYFELLLELENADHTIVGRFEELHRALKIMLPGCDFDWILKLGDFSIRALLPMRRRHIKVYHPRKLYAWGLALMKEAPALKTIDKQCTTYRDGLMICILASRAPRLRSLTGIRLGTHLTKRGSKYHLAFEPEDMKTKRALDYDLPVSLTGYIERYLAVERRMLLHGQSHDFFWVDTSGAPIKSARIKTMIRMRSTRKFGEGFGPHRFRHCIGTAAPMEDPQHPGVAPAMLGITSSTLESAYNLAGQIQASHSFVDVIRQARNSSNRRVGRGTEAISP